MRFATSSLWTRLMVLPLILLTLSGAPTASAVEIEEALPATTLLLAKTPSINQFREGFAETGFGRLLADEEMDALKSELAEKLEPVNAQLQEAIGVDLEGLLDLPQGEIALAVVPNDEGDLPVSVIIAADAGQNNATMLDVMTKLTDLAEQERGTVEKEQFNNLTLTVITPPDGEEIQFFWTVQESTYYIGLGRGGYLNFLEGVTEGQTISLASNQRYQQVFERLGNTAEVQIFLDVSNIVDTVLNIVGDQGNADPQQIRAFIQLFGLDKVEAFGSTVSLSETDYSVLARNYLYTPVGGNPTGVLSLFQMPVTSLQPEPWVPADVDNYSTLSWDLDQFYTALESLVNTFQPGLLQILEQQLVVPNGGQQLSFQGDIFDPLGDRVTVISQIDDVEDLASPQNLFAITLEDAEAFEGTLNKVFALTQSQPDSRQFQGVTIYDVDLPEVPAGPAGEMQLPESISFAIARETLFVSTEASLLEKVLRRGGSSLVDSDEFRALAEFAPRQASFVSFSRPEPQLRVLYDLFLGGGLEQLIQAGAVAGAPQDLPDLSEFIDVDTIPDFETFAKYIQPNYGYWVMEEDGLVQTSFELREVNP